jgi:hypothetical protein
MPVVLAPEERQRIGDEIDRLLALLDATDGDPDLEPALGSLDRNVATYGNPGGDQTLWALGSRNDLEDEHDGREPDVDDEPSLASLHGGPHPEFFRQTMWAAGHYNDGEEECDDEGACETASDVL